MTHDNSPPHIETNALAATLRECAGLLTLACGVDCVDEDRRRRFTAAAADASRQADALDTIRKQAHTVILGGLPFDILGGAFPMPDGIEAPLIIFKEASGETFGVGFKTRDAALRTAAAFTTLAIVGDFPEAPPGEEVH